MREIDYLKWMSESTDSQWCNDSADADDLEAALRYGASGCTTNPPLSYLALSGTPSLAARAAAEVSAAAGTDEYAAELIGVVVRSIAERLRPIYDASEGAAGYVRAQVRPGARFDADEMLRMGLTFASWAPNVMVKIPGTAAGMVVLEELAARGIPTNPTVCTTVPQMIAAAAAYDRGIARAKASGLAQPRSTSAIVLGRLQDYLAAVNEERSLGLPTSDLEEAALAVAKRSYAELVASGTDQVVMPAAFRSPRQVAQLAGGRFVMTIHPKVQDAIVETDRDGSIQRRSGIDEPVDAAAVARVLDAIPEFRAAYEPGGMAVADFDSYGAVTMTLDAFDVTGWQKLRTLELS